METATGDRGAQISQARAEDRPAATAAIRLRCPRCSANIGSLECTKCGLILFEENGTIHALPPARSEHYAQFIRDYERIRAAEGRSSATQEFYLELPFRDSSGRNSGQWRIRACTFRHLLQRILSPGVRCGGRILDLGAGNCWLSFRLTLAGYRPVAVDLLTNPLDGLGAAENYRDVLPALFPRFQAELAHLPFQDEQADAAIFNASFHYAEDDLAAVREALRCVKPGGMVIICDTPWYTSEESGRKMVAERHASFLARFSTTSSSIASIEFLTDERLQSLENQLSIHWTVFSPRYGLRFSMRPLFAKIRGRREPARFRIYVARKSWS
jgi:SAM-dependent methyltransferase